MAFSAEELYVMGLMAGEAAAHNPSLGEVARNELAVFAAQQTDLENTYCNSACTDVEQGM